MAYALLGHTDASGVSGYTTSAIDTTGADLIVLIYVDNTGGALSDNQSNTWNTTPPTRYFIFGEGIQIYYALCSGKTSATHTFTVTGTNTFSALAVLSFSGSAATPFDQENGVQGADQPGSVTPSEDNELIVAGFGWQVAGVTITSVTGMTIGDQIDAGAAAGVASAYKIQTTAAALNPTFVYSGSPSFRVVAQATFKAVAGGGGAVQWGPLINPGRSRIVAAGN